MTEQIKEYQHTIAKEVSYSVLVCIQARMC